MPRRQAMGTSYMLSLIALIVIILGLALIFFGWTSIQSTANTSLLIGLLLSSFVGLLLLYFTVSSSTIMMMALLFLGFGIILLLVNVLVSRS